MKSILETFFRLRTHGGSLFARRLGPSLDESRSSGHGVVVGKPGAAVHDFPPDVDLVGKKNRGSAGESFGHGDTEIFLMRRQDEGIGGTKGAPLHLSR